MKPYQRGIKKRQYLQKKQEERKKRKKHRLPEKGKKITRKN